MHTQTGRFRHRGGARRILLVLLALLVVLAAGVVMLPAFINMGLGRGTIQSALDDAVTGDAQFATIHTTWFGQQTLTGITLNHADGQQVANVDATLDAGLLALLTGSTEEYHITLSGTAETLLRADGTMTLIEAALPPAPSTEPLDNAIVIDIQDVGLVIHDEVSGREVRMGPMNGMAKVAPGGVLEVDVEGDITGDGESGRLALQAEASGVPVAGMPFQPAGAPATVTLRATNLPVLMTTREELLRTVEIDVNSTDLAGAINLTALLEVAASGEPDATVSELTADLTARELFNASGELALATDRLAGFIRGSSIPTALLQPLFAETALVLERDIGPLAEIDLTFTGEEGEGLAAVIRADQLDIEATGTMADDAINLESATITAAISPALRQNYLKPIHPILADIRHTEQRIVATAGPMVIPADGDLTKLNGRLGLTIGDVEFDSGSLTLALLQAFNRESAVVPGRIDPIAATISDGVLTYDTFSLRIDRFQMNYTGAADLVNRTLDLRTEIPLAGLAQSVSELRNFADQISVPLVTRGSFDKPETSIDPQFDLAKAAADAGFSGALDNLLKDTGLLKDDDAGKAIGDLLGDLLRGGKKKDDGDS